MKKLVFLIILLTGCSFSHTPDHHTNMEKSITAAVQNPAKNEIDLESITDFEWDESYLILPYSTQDMMEKQTGAHFKDPSGMDMRDDIYLLVFLHEDQAVQYAEVSREYGDLALENDTLKVIRR